MVCLVVTVVFVCLCVANAVSLTTEHEMRIWNSQQQHLSLICHGKWHSFS